MQQRLPGIDRTSSDKYCGGNAIFFQNRKGIFVIVAITVIKRDCDRSVRDITTTVTLHEFHQGHYTVAATQKTHMLLERRRMNGLEEGVWIWRHFMVREYLKAPCQSRGHMTGIAI